MPRTTEEALPILLESLNHPDGLTKGLGSPEPGKFCVEAAVCYAYGLPHDDEPTCVHPALRRLLIKLNDNFYWSCPQARAKGLKRLSILQLDTASGFDAQLFVERLILKVLKPMLITVFDGLKIKHDFAMATTMEKFCAAAATARTADPEAASAARAAARAAARSADAAAAAAAYTVDAARAATRAAIRAANASSASCTTDRAATQNQFIVAIENILIDMNVPGVQWLALVNNEEDLA